MQKKLGFNRNFFLGLTSITLIMYFFLLQHCGGQGSGGTIDFLTSKSWTSGMRGGMYLFYDDISIMLRDRHESTIQLRDSFIEFFPYLVIIPMSKKIDLQIK